MSRSKETKTIMISVVSMLVGASIATVIISKLSAKSQNKIQVSADKRLSLFLLMNQWVKVKQEKKNLASYFKRNNFRTLAIYGMGYAGERLIKELEDSDITIKYAIDKNAEVKSKNVNVVKPDDNLDEVDAIVVTPIFYMKQIEKELESKVSCPIICLEDVLYEV